MRLPRRVHFRFPRGAGGAYAGYREKTGVTGLGLDWTVPLAQARALQSTGAVQGNLDPTRLFSDKQRVISETEALVSSWKRRSGFIANLGHGILQRTPMENVTAFVETVRAGWR